MKEEGLGETMVCEEGYREGRLDWAILTDHAYEDFNLHRRSRCDDKSPNFGVRHDYSLFEMGRRWWLGLEGFGGGLCLWRIIHRRIQFIRLGGVD